MLENIDPEHRELLLACGRLAAERRELAFLVGGSVRDLVLGREHDDLDIVVEGDGMAVAQGLARSVDGELTRHHAFQTATVTTPRGLRVDVATARREDYPRPGQLPQVVPGNLQEDLQRRDFTINTMAISLGAADWGAFVDPLGGLADLRAGRIRVLHSRSFADDPTRVLRALRFALRFDYEIEEATQGWLREAVAGGYLADVSGDRVRKEIRLSFSENPVRAPVRLRAEGVLREVHPGLAADADVLRRLEETLERYLREARERYDQESVGRRDRDPADGDDPREGAPGDVPEAPRWVLGLTCCAAALSPQGRWELVRRLRLSREERAPVIDAGAPWRKAWAELSSVGVGRNSEVERALRPLSIGALLVIVAVSRDGSPEAETIGRYLGGMREGRTELGGVELLQLGVPEGPIVGTFLERLRAARLDGEVDSVDDERRMVRAWLADKRLR